MFIKLSNTLLSNDFWKSALGSLKNILKCKMLGFQNSTEHYEIFFFKLHTLNILHIQVKKITVISRNMLNISPNPIFSQIILLCTFLLNSSLSQSFILTTPNFYQLLFLTIIYCLNPLILSITHSASHLLSHSVIPSILYFLNPLFSYHITVQNTFWRLLIFF